MQHIVLILVSLVIGMLMRASGRFPDTTTRVLAGWVINVALPAAAFTSVHNLSLHADWWLAAATPWIGVLLCCAVMIPLCRVLGWSRERAGALVLVGGWGNTSFVGLPMIVAFAGDQWLGLGIVIDLFGSYLALSTVGLAIATVAGTGRLQWRTVVNRIATFPPFLAILIAFATNHLDRPVWLTDVFTSLGQTLTPIGLAAVGYALRIDRMAGRVGAVAAGLGYRLILVPAAVIALYLALGQADDPVAKVAMLEMAMPPSLGASIVAMDHDLEPDLVALLIGIGVPLSMLTVWLWWPLIAGL